MPVIKGATTQAGIRMPVSLARGSRIPCQNNSGKRTVRLQYRADRRGEHLKLTKKYMLEDYPRLERKCGLLDLYLYDSLNERKPDAVEHRGEFRAALYRADGAMGGYVVWLVTGNTHVEYLDEAIHRAQGPNDLADRRTIVCELQQARYVALQKESAATV